MELRLLQLFTFLANLILIVSAEKARYDNYRVYSAKVETEEQLKVFQEIENYPDGLSFMEAPMLSQEAEIIVPPHKFADISELFESFGIKSTLKIKNLQKLIDNEQPKTRNATFGWNAYYNLETIYEWIDEQLETYPEILTNLTVGTSFENRTIRAVKLSHKEGNPTILIESTIHAREWVTVATATYLLNELLTSTDPEIVYLARNYDWVIVPVLNVDGYAYTHSNVRMWRKTRQQHSKRCYGADLNRNYDVFFGQAGTSKNQCSEIYRGPRPFSEPESLAFSQFVTNFTNIKLFLTFHSYGQFLVYPYGHTPKYSPHNDDLARIANITVAAIGQRYGTRYTFGSVARRISPASGTTADYMYIVRSVPLSFTFEFRDNLDGKYGFLLPADQIIPNSQEVIDGLKAMIPEAKSLNYF